MGKAMRPPNEVIITEHALVRYLERVVGFDFSGYRDTLARRVDMQLSRNDRRREASVEIDGHAFVVDHGRIVTVLPEGGRAWRKKRR
jgi:hypothetical protein